MSNVTYYIGVWATGAAPTDQEVVDGTNALTHTSIVDASGDIASAVLAGLTGGTDYDVEAVAEEGSDRVRFTAAPFTTSSGYGITAVYNETSGTTPVIWNERTVADGTFGAVEGRVMVDSEIATVESWTDTKIVFTPLPGALNPDASYAVHVDRPV